MSVDTLFIAMTSATLKGSVILAIVLAAGFVFRRAIPARWMHLLLVVGMLRLLLPVAPATSISLFNLAGEPAAVAPRVLTTEMPEAASSVVTTARDAKESVPGGDPLTMALLAVWLGGFAIVVLRTLRHSFAARRIVRGATAIGSDASVAALLHECRALAGVTRRVRLAVSAGDSAPSMHGLLKPTLLLPATWDESLSYEQLRFVFLHELAHLRRLDVLVNWVTAAAHALHWFNPLVRIALARLAEERELACDALALEHLAPAERRAYGGTVLQLVDQWQLPAPVPGIVGMASTRQLMKRRIQMITAFRSDNRGAIWLALVSLLAVVSLTDARAGEQQVAFMKMHGPHTRPADARLEQTISLDLASASIEDVLHAISNRTGASISIDDAALDDAARATRLDLKAENMPAHLVLFETVGAFDLAVRFTESTTEVVRLPEGHEPLRIRVMEPQGADGDKVEKRVIVRKMKGDADGEKVVIRHHGDAAAESELRAAGEAHVMRKRIDVKADAENAGDGVTRRKVTYRGGEEGQAEGKLELEVRRANAS